MLVPILLAIIVILILQLINSVDEVSQECKEPQQFAPAYKINQRKIRREIKEHLNETSRKRAALERKFREQAESREREIASLAKSEVDSLKKEYFIKLKAAIALDDTALADSIKRDLAVLGYFAV